MVKYRDKDEHKDYTITVVLGFIFVFLAFLLTMAFVGDAHHKNLDKTVKVYTADGDLLAQFEGKIDVISTDSGHVEFTYGNKKHVYDNCFVETIINE